VPTDFHLLFGLTRFGDALEKVIALVCSPVWVASVSQPVGPVQNGLFLVSWDRALSARAALIIA
jgi:hypothetical protein